MIPQLVSGGEDGLPEYPLGRDVRLPGQYFLKFETMRWLNSEMYLTGDPEVRSHYLDLIFISQHQIPIGTLPVAPALQARLCRVDLAHWQALVKREPSPLHHWTLCLCDGGEVRLMHPVVLETLEDQLRRREKAEVARGEDAVRKRLARLRANMAEVGFDKSVIADGVLVERLDAWLGANHRGQRRQDAYDRAYTFAKREGWFAGKPVRR